MWSDDLSALPATDGLKHLTVEVPVTPSTFVVAVHRGAGATSPATHVPPDVVTNPVWVE